MKKGLWLVACMAAVSAMLSEAQASTKTITYVYSDPQGTPLAEADASGVINATFDYRPYGLVALGAAPEGPGYTGHVNEADTGLIYMQARYYDPDIGRFFSVDPLKPTSGDAFAFNRYNYADNSPLDHVDPDGRCIWDGCIVEIAVVGALVGGGIDAGAQKFFHPDQPINKTEVAISAVGGAVTGGTSALLTRAAVAGTITVGQAVLRQAAVSGTVGAAQSAAGNIADGQPVSGQAAINAAGANIAGSFLSSGISGAAGDFAGASANGAMQNMSGASITSPAGIGASIAGTTQAAGSTAAAPGVREAIASQASRVGDVAGTVEEKRLNGNQN